jgi:outer membrane protein assembly factor BamB
LAAVDIRSGLRLALFTACTAVSPLALAAETMYIATLRDNVADDTGGALYSVDLKERHASLIAPIRIGGAVPIGLTGLAVHPKTGVFYGITGGVSPNLPKSLVTIDPRTGNATLVGKLGFSAADIRFDAKGTLYAWLLDRNSLGTIDLGTGAARPIDGSTYEQTLGGGIAVNRDGLIYISANSPGGSLDTFDPRDGKVVAGPQIKGAPYVSSINSMAFGEDGTLYAVNSNLGTPAKTRLITIDVKTGEAKDLMALPDDVDPFSFGPPIDRTTPSSEQVRQREWIVGGSALVVGFLLGFGVAILPRRRRMSENSR